MPPRRILPALALVAALAPSACGHHNTAAPDARAAEPPLPPPTRPNDVVLEAHFAHPRDTLGQLGQYVGVHIPFELGLSLGLGIDSAVMSSADTQKPMDAVVTSGSGDRPEMLLVFTPTAGEFRSVLSGRFRLTPVTGLGDRLDPRQTSARPIEGMRCAVVGVPDTALPSRIVCGSSAELLAHAGRYAAFYSQRNASDPTDALVQLDGQTARAVLVPAAQRVLDQLAQSMASSAAEERREHNRPPDFGDPEAIVAMVSAISRALPAQAADVRALTLRARVERDAVTLDSELSLDPAGQSALARDAVARVNGPTAQPLASRLPPDSFAAFAARSPAPDRATLLADAVEAVVRVLGDRVPDPTAARADLTELFSHAGDAIAAGAAREPNNEGDEITVLFSLTDDGASARTALTRIARARWLTGLQLGGASVRPTLRGNTLTLQLPAAPAARPNAGAAGAATEEAPARPPAVVLSVAGDTLVFMLGHHAEASLAALGPRANGPAPGVLASAGEATAVGAMDVAAARGMADEHAPVTGTYGAAREGESVVGHGHLVMSARALSAIRRAIPGRNGGGGAAPRRRQRVDE